jgi:hypothetical protein
VKPHPESDEELLRDVKRRNVGERDPAVIRAARELALDVLGPHPLGGYRTREDSDHRDAIHESGHVIMALCQGVSFRCVMIRPEALTAGTEYLDVGARVAGDLGGAVAELEFLGDVVAEGCRTDLRSALDAAMLDAASRGEALTRVRSAVGRTKALLARREQALRALTSALLRDGALSYERCLDVFLKDGAGAQGTAAHAEGLTRPR